MLIETSAVGCWNVSLCVVFQWVAIGCLNRVPFAN